VPESTVETSTDPLFAANPSTRDLSTMPFLAISRSTISGDATAAEADPSPRPEPAKSFARSCGATPGEKSATLAFDS
jgi:hypothetical protein